MSEQPKPRIDPDDFFAVDMRVGRVIAVEPFPEARDPASKVTVDFGGLGTLRTSAQVTHYGVDELVGATRGRCGEPRRQARSRIS